MSWELSIEYTRVDMAPNRFIVTWLELWFAHVPCLPYLVGFKRQYNYLPNIIFAVIVSMLLYLASVTRVIWGWSWIRVRLYTRVCAFRPTFCPLGTVMPNRCLHSYRVWLKMGKQSANHQSKTSQFSSAETKGELEIRLDEADDALGPSKSWDWRVSKSSRESKS